MEDDIKLPQDCASWHVNTDDGFKQQETCSVSLASSKPLPADVTSRYQAGLAIVRDRKAARVAEVSPTLYQIQSRITFCLGCLLCCLSVSVFFSFSLIVCVFND